MSTEYKEINEQELVRVGMILQTERQNYEEYLRLKEITKGIPLCDLEELCKIYRDSKYNARETVIDILKVGLEK